VSTSKGIIVGCNYNQEWLLDWWWGHYTKHNDYPVLFVDFGMSEEGIKWCSEHGEYTTLPSIDHLLSSQDEIDPETRKKWETKFGKGIWKLRLVWAQKPFALLSSPFTHAIWIDLDCHIKGSLEPLFNTLNFGIEMAIGRDWGLKNEFLLPDETPYNSGVIAFKKDAKILHQWTETLIAFSNQMPGDQESLSRAIHRHKPLFFELPDLYNWPHDWGENENVLIHHYSDGMGKCKILKTLDPAILQKLPL